MRKDSLIKCLRSNKAAGRSSVTKFKYYNNALRRLYWKRNTNSLILLLKEN